MRPLSFGGFSRPLIAALVLLIASLFASVSAPRAGVAAAVPATSCPLEAAEARFGEDGRRANPHAAIFRYWYAQWCNHDDLGPATSNEYPIAPGTIAQDFRFRGQRLQFDKRTGAVTPEFNWGWAGQLFSAQGIQPLWGAPITRAWMDQLFHARSWGAALEPVERSHGPCGPQTQRFQHGSASFNGSGVTWRPLLAPNPAALVRVDEWMPPSDLTAQLNQALIRHDGSEARTYLSVKLRQKATARGLLALLHLSTWPDHAWHTVQSFSTSRATVLVRYVAGTARVTDTLRLRNHDGWRITALKVGNQFISCPNKGASAIPTRVSVTGTRGALGIGDSVMLDAQPYLAHFGIIVNAAVGRQFYQGIAIVQAMRAAGTLPDRVVIGLGTNGPISSQLFDQMMSVLRGEQRVVFVTVKEPNFWQDEVNSVLRAGVARWPNARLADWYAVSAANPGWFAADGIHVGPEGAQVYAQLIAQTLNGP